MTITLTIRTAMWRSHVARAASSVEGLVPVVKGNGYGFGRGALAGIAAEFSDTIAVGTVHELDGLPDGRSDGVPASDPASHAASHPGGPDVAVLTPTLTAPRSSRAILTIGHDAHVDAVRGWSGGEWSGRVVVKLASSMRRFGGDVGLIDTARRAGLTIVGVGIHPPLAGSGRDHRDEIEAILPRLDPAIPVWLSHLDAGEYGALPDTHRYRLRLGTALWHGDKSFLHLGADVLDVRAVSAGDRAGYRQREVAGTGHLVIIGAGTANGVTELADGRSPFHFDRRRLVLHEPPHMHTSMVFVPDGESLPAIGDPIDLQRPLITTAVDRYEWL